MYLLWGEKTRGAAVFTSAGSYTDQKEGQKVQRETGVTGNHVTVLFYWIFSVVITCFQ